MIVSRTQEMVALLSYFHTWIHHRDVATIDENGYGQIVGRIKDMLIRGGNTFHNWQDRFTIVSSFILLGENVYPREVEDVLQNHPDVIEAYVNIHRTRPAPPHPHSLFCNVRFKLFRLVFQVIGVPDKRLGEEVCAWVHLQPDTTITEEELRAFCSTRVTWYPIS